MMTFLFNVFLIVFCLRVCHCLPTNISSSTNSSVGTTVPSPITNVTLPGFFQARTTMIAYCSSYYRDCGKNGQCNARTSTCLCAHGYTTENLLEPCGYRQKSAVTAGCLSFFLGITGADWYYLSDGNSGYIAAGVFKLATLGGLGFWWLVDWIRVAAGAFPDGQGIPLI